MIRATNLMKEYQSATKPIIKDLNLQIEAGAFVIIMGSSGSGKSTLLYALSGLDTPTKGQIWLNNQLLNGKSQKELALFRRKEIGFIFQDHHLIKNLTLLENVMLPALWAAKDNQLIRQRALDLLQQMDIETLAHRLPSQISGGERQRCAIARALINKPTILMADEPTGNLNASATEQVLDIFSQLHKSGQTIVMVTHELNTASRGSEIIYLQDGQIEETLNFETALNTTEKESNAKNWLRTKNW